MAHRKAPLMALSPIFTGKYSLLICSSLSRLTFHWQDPATPADLGHSRPGPTGKRLLSQDGMNLDWAGCRCAREAAWCVEVHGLLLGLLG
ncbi:hypothetical protein N7466_006294 [Penicillium verhagenii]|uniref:uncharacterized protein n=1 Tax=Penicillium verhagenii TaxID=1562060 RepID=UPI00254529D8|nr:uncharacterized protein N7466_006294 [Penicillium verhagenii]KAJ5930801.1 hypothetical protein N7466_006294 [Penicillium verhagenii]